MIKTMQINKIIMSKVSYKEKIQQLKYFFEQENIGCFSDFDDTITQNTCLLYSKYRYLTVKKHIWWEKASDLLYPAFKINPAFIALVKKIWIKEIVIVSTNNLEFLNKIIQEKKQIFDGIWITIIGIVAKTNLFDFWIKDKRKILPKNATYISDIWEYKNFLWYNWFICVDTYSFLNYCFILCKKILFYLFFLIKNV